MTIRQMEYLVEIANCGSINKAAKNLFVSQPAISKAIKELEKNLNIEIFKRESSKKFQFTSEGKELLRYSRDFLDQVENMENAFVDKKHREFLRLIISSQHYAFVAQAFIDFMKLHHDNSYELFLRENKTNQIIEDVYTHQSNLGIISLTHATEVYMMKYLERKGLEFFSLKEFAPHVFIRKGHPLDGRESINLSDLSEFPYVSYEQDSNSLYFSEEAVIVKAKQAVLVLERASMNNIICNTNSYNIGTGFIAKSVTDKRLTSLPLKDLKDRLIVGWIKLKNIELSPYEREFISLCSLRLR